MNSFELRSRFFAFFKKNHHVSIQSSPVIPAQDPTLLFTNAGMNQFKDLFLGIETRDYKRAVSIQKCIRAGGKHNDLDNVGFTKRHLTFFEMMGNFSFGDYFKKEAIVYAWNFLVHEIGLPVEKLHATVFETDDQAFDIWHKEIGLPVERIHRLGAETNFWQMGDTGPCGPCSEIFIDRGIQYGLKDDTPASDSDRFLEIWNLVFMQYDRAIDGSLKPLKQTGVDTGMGLERLALVVQNVDSVFHTDLFMPIIARIEAITQRRYSDENDEIKAAFHVLADHIRSSVFLIAQGLVPSNEGRGYVLRKIIRRAALFGQKLKKELFFQELVSEVIILFSNVYPELKTQESSIYQVLLQETEKFSINLMRGTVLLNELFCTYQKERMLPGEQVFKLYDTFGFPVELITAQARHKGFSVDMTGFEKQMALQKDQSGKKVVDGLATFEFDDPIATEFTGYETLQTESEIIALIVNNRSVSSAVVGQEVYVIPKKSPFFIVGGGQVPDHGTVVINNQEVLVNEARYVGKTAIALKIVALSDFKVGDLILQKVDLIWRRDAMKNHTATHLLQAALIERYGACIKQSGSLVHPDYLRFDFTFSGNMSSSDLQEIELCVNTKIMDCISVEADYMSLEEATKRGALAFFGDKYKPDSVRMVTVDEFSKELCGGTHVSNTGQIGFFKILELTSPAAGLKRIVAVTGFKALSFCQNVSAQIKSLSLFFKKKPEQLLDTVEKQRFEQKQSIEQLSKIKKQYIHSMIDQWVSKAKIIGTTQTVVLVVESLFVDSLPEIGQLISETIRGVCLIIAPDQTVIRFVCAADAQNISRLPLFAAFLKQEHEIGCGVQKGFLQGSSQAKAEQIVDLFEQWVAG